MKIQLHDIENSIININQNSCCYYDKYKNIHELQKIIIKNNDYMKKYYYNCGIPYEEFYNDFIKIKNNILDIILKKDIFYIKHVIIYHDTGFFDRINTIFVNEGMHESISDYTWNIDWMDENINYLKLLLNTIYKSYFVKLYLNEKQCIYIKNDDNKIKIDKLDKNNLIINGILFYEENEDKLNEIYNRLKKIINEVNFK